MIPETLFPRPIPSFQRPVALPASEPDAGDQVCVQFSKAWLPLVRGALLQLLLKSTWETTDEDAINTVQGQVFNLIDMFNDEASCVMFDIRIDPENDCMLQKTVDGGDTWQDVGSLYYCAKGAAADEIANEIADGILGTRGQQPPQPPSLPGECHTYHVQLNANDRWHCPEPVSTGATVYVTNATGGWYDGYVWNTWQCPDALHYLLGGCTGAKVATQETDPCQTAYHMQIVANTGAEWGDPLTSAWTIPAGIGNQELYIQANDSPLTDNQGSVQFDVQVCPSGWTHVFDFTADDGGWTAITPPTQGQWLTGQGWNASDFVFNGEQYRQVYIQSPAFASRTITRVQILSVYAAGYKDGQTYDHLLRDAADDNLAAIATPNLPGGTNTIPVWSGSQATTRLKVHINASHLSYTGQALITEIIVSGIGTDPFV